MRKRSYHEWVRVPPEHESVVPSNIIGCPVEYTLQQYQKVAPDGKITRIPFFYATGRLLRSAGDGSDALVYWELGYDFENNYVECGASLSSVFTSRGAFYVPLRTYWYKELTQRIVSGRLRRTLINTLQGYLPYHEILQAQQDLKFQNRRI